MPILVNSAEARSVLKACRCVVNSVLKKSRRGGRQNSNLIIRHMSRQD